MRKWIIQPSDRSFKIEAEGEYSLDAIRSFIEDLAKEKEAVCDVYTLTSGDDVDSFRATILDGQITIEYVDPEEWQHPDYYLTAAETSAHQANADRFASEAMLALGRFAAFVSYFPEYTIKLKTLRKAIDDANQAMQDGRV